MKKILATCLAALAIGGAAAGTASATSLASICAPQHYNTASTFYSQTAQFYNAVAIDFIKKGDIPSAEVYQSLARYFNTLYAWMFVACQK
jgi:hypothetical protein